MLVHFLIRHNINGNANINNICYYTLLPRAKHVKTGTAKVTNLSHILDCVFFLLLSWSVSLLHIAVTSSKQCKLNFDISSPVFPLLCAFATWQTLCLLMFALRKRVLNADLIRASIVSQSQFPAKNGIFSDFAMFIFDFVQSNSNDRNIRYDLLCKSLSYHSKLLPQINQQNINCIAFFSFQKVWCWNCVAQQLNHINVPHLPGN